MAAATTKSHFHHQNDSSAPSGGGVHKQTRRPRPITETERAALDEFLEKVHYSPRLTTPSLPVANDRYSDDDFEYRFAPGYNEGD
jgi:hypothetical protein